MFNILPFITIMNLASVVLHTCSGGVTLSFKGRNLDVVLNPVLIVDVDNDTLRNVSHNDYKAKIFFRIVVM